MTSRAPPERGALVPPIRPEAEPAPAGEAWRRTLAGRPTAWLLAGLVFLAVYPTLGWTQFHHSIENFNVATALELRRGGPWLVPTLQGVPRLAKPPLTAWITATALQPDTLRDLDAAEAGTRAAAYKRLAVEARWPALLAMCLLLVATYELGRAAVTSSAAAGHRVGLTAAAACASTFFFVRHSHFATTDVQLALWVAVANAALAHAVVRRRYAWSLPVAGVALGFALMAKGPVAIVQTLLPVGLFLLLRSHLFVRTRGGAPRLPEAGVGYTADDGAIATKEAQGLRPGQGLGATDALVDDLHTPRSPLVPALIGVALMLIVGAAWFVAVAATRDQVWHLWKSEVTRVDADDVPAGAWYAHVVNLIGFGPWLIWMALGTVAVAAAIVAARRAGDRNTGEDGEAGLTDDRLTAGVLSLSLLIVPLVVMSFPKDRFDRYLLPLVPAGAVLAAVGLEVLRDRLAWQDRVVRLAVTGHWVVVVAWAVLQPLAAATRWFPPLRTTAGGPWFSWPLAAALAVVPAVCIVWGLRRQRIWPGALAVATFGAIAVGQVGYTLGRSRSPAGEADLRPAAEMLRADPSLAGAVIYAKDEPKRNKINIHANALSIYVNRPATWAHDPTTDAAKEPHPVVWVVGRGPHHPPPPRPPPPDQL